MRSVPRNIDHKGELLSRCDVCSVPYLRSALRRGIDGLLRCANDRPGRYDLQLAQLTAARAAALSQRLGQLSTADGAFPDVDSAGNPSSTSSYTGPTRKYTVDDVYFENGGAPTYANPGTLVNKPGF
jgi:hypothetical protein